MSVIPFENSFASHEKSKYWSDKNELKPRQVFKCSNKKFWFDCDVCGHEFLIRLNVVTRGGWCNYCSNNNLCNDDNCNICFNKSFASHEKSNYWSNKNELKPRQVFKSTNDKYIFNCNICGHEFLQIPNSITTNNCWCSYCSNKKLCNDDSCKLCFDKSFASHEKSKYWSGKNELKPRQVFKCSSQKYWFECDKCKHEFISNASNITKGNWCPYCNSCKLCENEDCITCFNRSFASHKKSNSWNSKNELKPRQVFQGSGQKYWFDCDKCNHTFQTSPQIISMGCWCNFCSNDNLCENINCKTCFDKSFASNEKSKYWSDKNTQKPIQVFKYSQQKYWFDCDKCNHSFSSLLSNISKTDGPRWCPYCSVPCKLLCDDEKCNHCFNKSFASHEKAKYWSIKNKLKPRQVCKFSGQKYWFNCDKCTHTFDILLGGVNNGNWCRYCPNQSFCLENCDECYNKSMASHEKSQFWSKKNKLTPREVMKVSRKKYWFDCNKCNHTFETIPYTVTNTDSWCNYCANQILCESDECKICFEKSFASNEKSKYWSDKNELKPRQVFKYSSKKIWFDCYKCNLSFSPLLSNISKINQPTWCPHCVNKTELKLHKQLLSIYPNIISQFKQEWCKKINYLPFDFCILEYKIIIELDGPQHFQQISNWDGPDKQQENDKFKEECANNNGYSVIRLLQEDVMNDKYDWVKELCEAIEEIKNGDEIANVYLCKNDEYNTF